jgi:hypothetical protein
MKIEITLSQNISFLWTWKSWDEAEKNISLAQRGTKHSPCFVSEQKILLRLVVRECKILCNFKTRSSHKMFVWVVKEVASSSPILIDWDFRWNY